MKNTSLKEINEKEVVVEKEGQEEDIIDNISTVVLAVGYDENNQLYNQLKESGINVQKAGDCAEPRKIIEAIHEGFQAAYNIK